MIIERYFEDYAIGETNVTSGRTITEADIVLHAGQTGDFFPHHMDAAWCATQPFKQRIAHGTLVFHRSNVHRGHDPRSLYYCRKTGS